MFYEFSSDETYVLIRALRCLQSVLYERKLASRVFKIQYQADIEEAGRLIQWLYDRGLDANDTKEAEELAKRLGYKGRE